MMHKHSVYCSVLLAIFGLPFASSFGQGKKDDSSSPPKYVPVKLEPAEAQKLQADWAEKLKVKPEAKTPTGISLVLIPPAGPALPKPYWIGKYEVTQGEWKAVIGSNPSSYKEGNKEVKGLDTSRHPVETVTWFACLEFCNRLGEKEGLKPYYGINVIERSKQTKQITKAEIEILGGEGYRLPTPDEWAHSCRAGSVTDFFFGDKGEIDKYGWVDTNSENRTHAVGEKKPNAFGLHDTHGNVREWALEFMTDEKTKAISRARCYGGSFHYKADACGAGSSGRWHGPHDALSFCGLRVARDASPAAPKK